MSIPSRKIGKDMVPSIGLGTMGLSIGYGEVGTDEERFEILDAALEAGSTHWDTADVYGDAEDLLGKWFKRTGKRDSIFLATKFGIQVKSMSPITLGVCGTAEYMKQQFNKSLQRLGVEYIDLYYIHRVDPDVPIEVTVNAMAELVKEGKVKYLGISECNERTLRRAHAVHPISALQIEYSPFFLELEDPKAGLLKACRELGIKIIAYSPLGRGLITGQIKSLNDLEPGDARRYFPKFSPENFPLVLSVVDEFKALGEKHGATPGQVTLAWILAQGEDFHVIPGTKKLKYLNENVGSAKVKLSQKEITAARKIVEKADKIPGDRFQTGARAQAGVDTPPFKA